MYSLIKSTWDLSNKDLRDIHRFPSGFYANTDHRVMQSVRATMVVSQPTYNSAFYTTILFLTSADSIRWGVDNIKGIIYQSQR